MPSASSDAVLKLEGIFLWPPYPSVTDAKPLSGTLTIGYQSHDDHFDSYISWSPTEEASNGTPVNWPKQPQDCLRNQAYISTIPSLEPELLWFLGGNRLDADQSGIHIPLASTELKSGRTSEIKAHRQQIIECRLLAPALRSPQSKSTSVIYPVIESRLKPRALTRPDADNSLRLPGITDTKIDIPLFTHFSKELLAALGTRVQELSVRDSIVRLLPGEHQARWILGPYSAKGLGNGGTLRDLQDPSGVSWLGVSLDGTDRLTVPSGTRHFWFVLTGEWSDKFDSITMRIDAAWKLSDETSGIKNLITSAMKQIGDSVSSLRSVLGGQAQSFLLYNAPEVSWIVPENAAASARLYAGATSCNQGVVTLAPRTKADKRPWLSLLSPFPNDATSYNSKDPMSGRIEIPVCLPGLEQRPQQFVIALTYDPSAGNLESDNRFAADNVVSFRITNAEKATPQNWQTRVGAFRLGNGRRPFLAPDGDEDFSRLAIAWPFSGGHVSVTNTRSLAIGYDLRLQVNDVIPVTVDFPWGDREERPLPLVIRSLHDLKKASKGPNLGSSPFVLQIRESIAPDRDRWLVANLYENSVDTDVDEETFTLLAQQPISVVRFTRRRINRLGDAGNAIVASFNSDDRIWHVKLAIPEYHFEFPPQVIGESADKPSRLELHDINETQRLKDDVVRPAGDAPITLIRPAPSRGVMGDPDRSYLVECRLTPSMDLWIRPSDLERGYFLPEWAAFEIFRQRNDFGIGVSLRGLRGEFLYGLMVGIIPRLETGPDAQARVAEIEAITGQIPSLIYVGSSSSPILTRWEELRRALLKRFERLEIWTPMYEQTRPFGYSRFSAGVTFALRKTALHRLPVSNDSFTSSESTDPVRIDRKFGLSGGALWPLESLAFVNRIRELPTSDGGSIERIAISPEGGDADLSASFLNGRLKIVSETRAGFVQMQKTEILGRIGVFWHRAKHVIVFERTVNPSEQFAPVADDVGWHKSRSRRAILRKVTEYVEIIEPTRSYPDDAGNSGNAGSCGFLDSVRFNSKIIHVDSAWSEEINLNGVSGYAIPLWNLGASQQRPNVYPMPGVTSVTIGEGKEERPLQPRQLSNPENLYFYAQASGTEGDSNKWAAVYGVDYGNLIDPVELETQTAPGGNGFGAPNSLSKQGRKPSSPRLLPGYNRFTWRLLPDGARTTLNSGFSGDPVYGNLESFSFSRGSVVKYAQVEGLLKSHLAHAQAFADIPDLRAFLATSLGELQSATDDASRKLSAERTLKSFETLKQQCSDAIAKLPSDSDLKNVYDDIKLTKLPLDCTQIKRSIVDTLQRKRQLVAHALRDWTSNLENEVNTWTATAIKDAWDAIKNTSSAREHLVRTVVHENLLSLNKLLAQLFNDVQTSSDAIVGEVAIARRIAHECVTDFSTTLRRAVSKIRAAFDGCQSQIDWSDDRYTKLRIQVNEHLAGVIAELTAVATETNQRLGAELGPFGARMAKAIAAGIAEQLKSITIKMLPEKNKVLPAAVKQLITDAATALDHQALQLNTVEINLFSAISAAAKELTDAFGGFSRAVREATINVLEWGSIGAELLRNMADDTVNRIASNLNAGIQLTAEELGTVKSQVLSRLPLVPDLVAETGPLTETVESIAGDIAAFCKAATSYGEAVVKQLYPENLANELKASLKTAADAYADINLALGDVTALKDAIVKLATSAGEIGKSWSGTVSATQAYSSRVMEGFNRLGKGGVGAAPGNVLRLLSAATAAPEIAQMQANIDRMRCSYTNAKVQTSKALSSLSKVGDALKALGIEVPFTGISDQLEIPEEVLKEFDFKRLFPSFGGLDLSGLLGDVRIPPGVSDAVRIRHEFDKSTFRAWVEVDVDVPVPGRKQLFGLGPFVMYFRDSLLTGRMRAEASQDSDQATTSGTGTISTNIDVDIGGERILSLERAEIRYSQGGGLKFTFDAKNIKLHSALQFVQDTLGQLIGDEIGGMKILKESGIPVGVEHQFALPTISLMGVTSGISNIQLSNTFRLRAYPDFVLSNRFNLSRPELPFIFSFFIVGGTGYSVVDASYRPFDKSLTVEVEGAAGGSAALGIAFGPISGSVFFTLSLALTYRKTIGPSGVAGSGLTVSFVMVMAGNVTVWGFIEIYVGMMLRLSYQENGAIDAKGSVSIEVEVCMFLTLSFSAEVAFRMRDGHSTTTTQSRGAVEEGERIKQLRDRANQLQGARA